jgi:hypothetical protein
MHVKQTESILDRLGLTTAALENARKDDLTLDEACCDLEQVGSELEGGSPDPELVRLANELEVEIRQRLSTSAKSSG